MTSSNNTQLTAEAYKDSLPKNGLGTKWTIETYATYVNLLYPHITVPLDQEWKGTRFDLKHICSKHKEYIARPSSVMEKNQGCQCRSCANERTTELSGKTRRIRATQEEKNKAAVLKGEGKTFTEIANILGRNKETIRAWLKPGCREQKRIRSALWCKNNYQQKKENDHRYRTEFKHGKANARKAWHKRRSIEFHCADYVFLPDHPDADHQGFVYYDMWQDYVKGDSEAMNLFSFEGADEAVAFRKKQQEKFEKFSGIKWSLDHLVPLSRGGIHHPLNFVNLPLADNTSKNNKRIQKDDELFCKRLFDIK